MFTNLGLNRACQLDSRAICDRYDGFPNLYDGFATRYDGFTTPYDGLTTRYDGFPDRYDGNLMSLFCSVASGGTK